MLQTCRHVIQSRQLEERILGQVHLSKHSEIAAWGLSDRRAILQDLRAQIEDWHRLGSIVGSPWLDNVPIHSSITWMSARFYDLLNLLCYPSPFNNSGCTIATIELLRFVQKHIQSTSALFQHRQLPMNRITLYRTLPVAYVLMYSAFNCTFDGIDVEISDEAAVLLCIWDSFPDKWTSAPKAAQVIRQFILTMKSPLQDSNSTARQAAAALHLRDMVGLMQRSMGRTSVYGNTGPILGDD